MIEFLNFYLIPGLVLGSIYALGAIGVTLTFGILRFANFAHGETMTLGAFIALSLAAFTGWHPFAVLPFAMALTALAVLGMDRLFFRPLRHGSTIILVIASFGLMLMVRSLVQLIWGAKLRSFGQGIELPWILFDALRLFPKHVTIVCAALVLMLAVHLLLAHTRAGKAMRAMADSPDLARLTGIDTERVILTHLDRRRGARGRGRGLPRLRHPRRVAARLQAAAADLRRRPARGDRAALRRDGGRAGDRPRRGALHLPVDRHRAPRPARLQDRGRLRDHGRDPDLAPERALPGPGVLAGVRSPDPDGEHPGVPPL